MKTTVESASLLGQTLFQNSSTDTTLTSYAGHIRYILDVDYVCSDEVDVDQNSIETILTSYARPTRSFDVDIDYVDDVANLRGDKAGAKSAGESLTRAINELSLTAHPKKTVNVIIGNKKESHPPKLCESFFGCKYCFILKSKWLIF